MSGPSHLPWVGVPTRPTPHDWATVATRAAAALQGAFNYSASLAPRAVARVTLGELPRALRRRLQRWLRMRGWLAPAEHVPLDALDAAALPSGVPPGAAAVVRLAVFGLPGQGLPARDKRRDGLFQQLCAEIMRSAVDPTSLDAVARRVLNHPEVNSDSSLAAMLRGFISQRGVALRTARMTPDDEFRRRQERSKLRNAFVAGLGTAFPTQAEVHTTLTRFETQFDGALARYDDTTARHTLDLMRDLRQRYPAHVAVEHLQHCEERFDRFMRESAATRRQLHDLATQVMAAAQAGDTRKANWIVRRLEAIHKLLPTLLPLEQCQSLCESISTAEHDFESREITEELYAEERSVAEEIKTLAGVVHRYHELIESQAADEATLSRAAANYRAAVDRIRALDSDWLAGLMLQLERYFDDLDDPEGRLEAQLARFVAGVRTALNRLRLEVRAIRAQQAQPPPDDASAPSPPPAPPVL